MIPATVTTIRANTRIRRERWLPQAGEITVALGQQVTPVQVVARTSQQRGYTIIPGAEILGVRPENLADYLLVEEGAAVQRKKPLLEKRSLFGSKTVTSSVNGVLYQISHGRLILQQSPELFELRAMLPGIVTNFLGNRGVVIEAKGALIEAKWSTGREGYGAIRVLEKRDTVLSMEHIGAEARGSILVVGHIQHLGPLEVAEENSARGVIAGSAPSRLVPEFTRFRFPILLTEGFGTIPMSTPVFNLLQQCHGREATMLANSGHDWRNPEIIVPMPEAAPPEAVDGTDERLRVGQMVRVWREPHAGKAGKIVALVKRSRPIEPGYRVPGAEVALEDGNQLFVPYANLDMIR